MVAEFAVALPAVVAVLLLSAAALNACALQVRLQDAAADAARLAGRGESDGRVSGAVAAVGGSMAIDRRDDLVCVTASGDIPPLGALHATSCALAGGR
ncbi:TadE family type IV pilus minor pilin [Microbacterium sp. P01]|uniref:TadE family type IV pilus minor pilin n=1 Tax=unclassified Microbacterium TaxID=2609290 RepID=UPI003670AE3F